MVINTEKLQEVCKKVLDAVDNNSALPVSSSVELLTEGRKLFINITNMEYYVSIDLDLDNEVDSFRVVVDAHLFLNLIAKMTTEDIELTINDKSLVVKGNGNYKVPIITDAKGIVNVVKSRTGLSCPSCVPSASHSSGPTFVDWKKKNAI